MLYRIVADDLRVVVLIAFDAAIDMQLNRSGHAVGSLFKDDLHLVGAMIVIEQFDLLADQGHRCFEQLAVKRDRAVFGDFSPDPLSEVVGQVVGAGRKHFMLSVNRANGVWPVAPCWRWW
jgi:hypothetical protein